MVANRRSAVTSAAEAATGAVERLCSIRCGGSRCAESLALLGYSRHKANNLIRDLRVQVLSELGPARSCWIAAASRAETLCFGAPEFWRIPLREGTGGSAMPCGLVLPAASAKLTAGDWLPEVRDAAAVN